MGTTRRPDPAPVRDAPRRAPRRTGRVGSDRAARRRRGAEGVRRLLRRQPPGPRPAGQQLLRRLLHLAALGRSAQPQRHLGVHQQRRAVGAHDGEGLRPGQGAAERGEDPAVPRAGKFFQPLDLSDYPLDDHELTLIVEDTTYAETRSSTSPTPRAPASTLRPRSRAGRSRGRPSTSRATSTTPTSGSRAPARPSERTRRLASPSTSSDPAPSSSGSCCCHS
jgi:hypothetical protein